MIEYLQMTLFQRRRCDHLVLQFGLPPGQNLARLSRHVHHAVIGYFGRIGFGQASRRWFSLLLRFPAGRG